MYGLTPHAILDDAIALLALPSDRHYLRSLAMSSRRIRQILAGNIRRQPDEQVLGPIVKIIKPLYCWWRKHARPKIVMAGRIPGHIPGESGRYTRTLSAQY